MSPDSGDEYGRRLRDEVRFGVLGPVTVTDGASRPTLEEMRKRMGGWQSFARDSDRPV